MANYKPHLNLQQLSTVAIAASAWKRQSVINGIKKFFEKNADMINPDQPKYCVYDSYKDWTEIISLVKNYVDEVRLPTALKPNLIATVTVLGPRIHRYLEETVVKLLFCGRSKSLYEDIEYYIRNIQWTPFGTIDTVGVFMRRYNNETIENDLFMWYESCIYCLENCMKSLWTQVRINCDKKVYDAYEKTFVLTAYWRTLIASHYGDLLECLTHCQRLELDLPNSSDLENIMLISVALGRTEAVKYFWRQLSSQQRQENSPRIFDILGKSKLLCCHFLARYFCSTTECYSDILAFIIGELTDKQVQLLSDSIPDVLPMLLKWPWWDLFSPVLEEIWDLLNDNTLLYLLNCLIEKVSDVDPTGWSYKSQDILIYMWKKLPINFKENISANDIHFKFSALHNPSVIQFVLADPHVHLSAVDVLPHCHCLFELRIMEEKYEEMDAYIRGVCRSENEREECVKSIDVIVPCTAFLKEHKYEKIERLFQWRFRGDVEGIGFLKKNLVADRYCFAEMVKNICTEMWETDNAKCKEVIINDIKWLTGCSDEKLTTESLKRNDQLCQIFMTLCDDLQFDVCDLIFSCYSLTDEEINALKSNIFLKFLVNDPEDMMNVSYMQDVGMNFDWACNSVEKKYNFLNAFLASQDAEVYFTNVASVDMYDDAKISFFEDMTANWFGASSREEIVSFAERLRTRWSAENFSGELLRNFNLFLMYLDNIANE